MGRRGPVNGKRRENDLRPTVLPDQHARVDALKRVAVTGCGIVTPLGFGWRVNAEGFRTGRKAFRDVTLFDAGPHRCKQAGEVDSHLLGQAATSQGGRPAERLDRAAKLLLAATEEAWLQSGCAERDGVACILGTTSGGMALGEQLFKEARTAGKPGPGRSSKVFHYLAYQQAMEVVRRYRLNGPVRVIANACASGANAIGHGWRAVASGRVRIALVGGYDALSQLVFSGFAALQALTTSSCRPFAATRDGLMLGEGAAVLMLEEAGAASARGAHILGEIAAYAGATDTHHLTQPHPSGAAATRCMKRACEMAGLRAEDIDYINAHGTGTVLNDASEASAIQAWAGCAARKIRVSSTKADIGHLLGAAGAVEAAVCLMALDGQWLPPEIGVGDLDPVCTFDLVRAPMSVRVENVLTNSFGFGGANACLALRRWG